MTKNDYRLFAALVQQMPPRITKQALVNALCLLFALDNPRFKREAFLKACQETPNEEC